MMCRLAGSNVELETPLVRAEVNSALRVGIRAGDILLAPSNQRASARETSFPEDSFPRAARLIVVARVDCGVEMEVHLTLAARDSLQLQPGHRSGW